MDSHSTARAQQSQIPIPPPPTIPGVSPTGPESDPATRRMAEQMGLRRNTERQKQIVADTARLLQLAQKLNDEVSKTNQNMLPDSRRQRGREIEKLAKTIKDKMRDGT